VDSDILDEALRRPLPPDSLTVEIEHSALPLAPQPLAWWRREPGASAPLGADILDWVTAGYVLDVGCGTGRDLETLAGRGIPGHGVERTPAAVGQATGAGVSCVLADVFEYCPPHPVDTVLAIGGNGGMAATLANLPGFLRRLSSWLSESGRIVFSSTDWRLLPAEKFALREPASGYRGDIRMRLALDGVPGPWFPWLFADPDALAGACAEAGLRIVARKEWQGGIAYGALLERAA